jgi:hypothetical protein
MFGFLMVGTKVTKEIYFIIFLIDKGERKAKFYV